MVSDNGKGPCTAGAPQGGNITVGERGHLKVCFAKELRRRRTLTSSQSVASGMPSHKGTMSAEGATIGDRREGVYGIVVICPFH